MADIVDSGTKPQRRLWRVAKGAVSCLNAIRAIHDCVWPFVRDHVWPFIEALLSF